MSAKFPSASNWKREQIYVSASERCGGDFIWVLLFIIQHLSPKMCCHMRRQHIIGKSIQYHGPRLPNDLWTLSKQFFLKYGSKNKDPHHTILLARICIKFNDFMEFTTHFKLFSKTLWFVRCFDELLIEIVEICLNIRYETRCMYTMANGRDQWTNVNVDNDKHDSS